MCESCLAIFQKTEVRPDNQHCLRRRAVRKFRTVQLLGAKLSQVGFTETLAKEGVKYNILCNVIAPIAASRMTATVMPPMFLRI